MLIQNTPKDSNTPSFPLPESKTVLSAMKMLQPSSSIVLFGVLLLSQVSIKIITLQAKCSSCRFYVIFVFGYGHDTGTKHFLLDWLVYSSSVLWLTLVLANGSQIWCPGQENWGLRTFSQTPQITGSSALVHRQ